MLKIDGPRLWASLITMAQIGATPKGGVRRLALTDDDRRSRALFVRWCVEAGMTVRIDEVGNLFARREGSNGKAKAVLIGSHLDTQPEGGRFDGVYGVLAALEVVRTLNDQGLSTEKPIEIVSWTNEEGARFTPAMLGSAVFVGATPLAAALQTRDAEGVTLREALKQIGYAGTRGHGVESVDSYFEAHIEQGPILESHGNPIGVVTGGQAIRWLDVEVTGVAAHAGTTPMPYRKDALFASAAMALELEAIAQRFAPLGLVTIGQVEVPNSSRNTIAGCVAFSVDLRHPDDTQIDAMEREVRELFGKIAEDRGLKADISTYWKSPATPFDTECVELVEEAAKGFGYAHERIVSGAGHDAIHLARHVPTAMVFIPCVDGLSHNEAEDALPEDVTCGANVLINAVLARAVAAQ
ncbi:Zn-dependent hydrolase [Caballeronia mineralivorans]|jgi:N-carbamoyl-L-amino-acid hydrolase|uniref:Zn-dependent hydrolase n=1 Tax=Caballeronia mineralivorans TaxID=2010198 RepID=UPI002AFFC811|nr:Zn-dependent hydrolase [Caballeronia mineralivorans]MEA3102596.1 beta-ureidopropionase / N-carbamoyl-L-amino-acid hydrolase [Caballeronia mineralivorans]